MNLINKFKNTFYYSYNLIQKIRKFFSLFLFSDNYIFTKFYINNKWGDSESKSGEGSTKKNTSQIRKIIPSVVKNYSVKTFFDVPCGDFNWMRYTKLYNCNYTGADIVSLIIKENQKKYSNPQRLFINFNMIKNTPPKVDLIFCRDALVHLSNNCCLKVLKNFKRSGSKFLLTTHFPNEKKNNIITNGMFRRINLEINPFNFPAPLEIFLENKLKESSEKKYLALWELNKLKFNN